jgi:hypothetical protein
MSVLGDFWLNAVFDGLEEMKKWESWADPVIKMVMASMTRDDEKAIVDSLKEEIERDFTWAIVRALCMASAMEFLADVLEAGITIDEEGYFSQRVDSDPNTSATFCDTDRLCGWFYMGTYNNLCHRRPSFDENCVEMMDYFYEKALEDVGFGLEGSCTVGVPESGDVTYIMDFKPSDLREKKDA